MGSALRSDHSGARREKGRREAGPEKPRGRRLNGRPWGPDRVPPLPDTIFHAFLPNARIRLRTTAANPGAGSGVVYAYDTATTPPPSSREPESVRPPTSPPALLTVLAALTFALGVPVHAQMLTPEPTRYTAVSQVSGVEAMWSNPGALGFSSFEVIEVTGLLAFSPNPGQTDAEFRQGLLGARAGPLAIGLRRDRFLIDPGDEVTQEGTGLTIAVAMGGDRFSFGASSDQYQRAVTSSRWEIGGLWRAMESLNVGLSWRDIGSPVVIARERPWTLVGGATYQIPEGWGEASLEATLERGSLEGFRGVVRLETPVGADVLALADVNADGEVQRFSIGLGYQFGDFRGFGIGSRNRDRDGPEANEYTIGATGNF